MHKTSDNNYTIAIYLLNSLYQDNVTINTNSKDCHISVVKAANFPKNISCKDFNELKMTMIY